MNYDINCRLLKVFVNYDINHRLLKVFLDNIIQQNIFLT